MAKRKDFNTKYSGEFKICVIMDMRENHLSYSDTVRKYWGAKTRTECSKRRSTVRSWERIYLEEGAAGLMAEHRRKKNMEKQPLDKAVEEDLIAENQRLKERNQYLEAELEYIKKLSALVQAEEQKNGKKQ